MNETQYYFYPCCKSPSLASVHEFEICSICGWEDDNVQFQDPNFSGGANDLSLNEYRRIFLIKKSN